MPRLRSFPEHRFVGTRDDMKVHDCDDADAYAALEERIEEDELLDGRLLQSFAPDTLAEARNRGFTP